MIDKTSDGGVITYGGVGMYVDDPDGSSKFILYTDLPDPLAPKDDDAEMSKKKIAVTPTGKVEFHMLPLDDPAWIPPPRLDTQGKELWKIATGGLGGPHNLAMLSLQIRHQLELENTIIELREERDCLRATFQMACDTMGGEVDGQPPHSGNFIQRIREIMRNHK